MALAKGRNRRKMISKMVDRIVEHFDPEKIILFGSHARGGARPDSDVDLCSPPEEPDQKAFAEGDSLQQRKNKIGLQPSFRSSL